VQGLRRPWVIPRINNGAHEGRHEVLIVQLLNERMRRDLRGVKKLLGVLQWC
jgi:hypothetical protein